VIRSIDDAGLASYLSRQLNAFFPDGRVVTDEQIRTLLPEALARTEHCFSRVNSKYFFDGRSTVFDHLHGDQYAMFLYLAANTAHRMGLGEGLPSKLFLLNKTLHGIDAYYEVDLPSVFLFVHPLGTVLGRGRYGDYFLVYQGCGVGSNHDVYPTLDEFVTLRPGSFVLGRSHVGRHSTLAAGAMLIDTDLPGDTVYFGTPGASRTRAVSGPQSVWRR
jgi:serine O-acetyltransferase